MKKILVIAIVLTSFLAKSQELTVFYKGEQGASYSQSTAHDDNFEPDENDWEMIKQLFTTHQQEFSKHSFESILRIDNDKSIYYPKDKILNDTITNIISYKKGENLHEIKIIEYTQRRPVPIVYMNLDSKRKIIERMLYEKKYLVHEDLIFLDWNITEEKKQIGKYTCTKAIYEPRSDYTYDPPRIIEAWFTNEIENNHGPMGFGGLPGLILELRNGGAKIVMDKIISGAHSVKVTEPKEGEKISKQDFVDLPSKLFNRN